MTHSRLELEDVNRFMHSANRFKEGSADLKPTQNRVLLVDDDAAIAEMLKDVLESNGYEVVIANTGVMARTLVRQRKPHLITLDLVLPDEDGLVLCSALKMLADVPILVCSGTRRRRDAMLTLKLGADGFIAKPFEIHELLARAEVLLRRTGTARDEEAGSVPGHKLIRVGDLQIDTERHNVMLRDTMLRLTATEYRLLVALAERPNQVLPRDSLATLVRGHPDAATSRAIDVHVGRLRVKMGKPGPAAPQIVSVRGFGYKIASCTSKVSAAEDACD